MSNVSSLKTKASVFLPGAVGMALVPALLHAPLPAELGGLVVACVLAHKSPEILASLKESLPFFSSDEQEDAPVQEDRTRVQGQRTLMDKFLGRNMGVGSTVASLPTDEQPKQEAYRDSREHEDVVEHVTQLLNDFDTYPRGEEESATNSVSLDETVYEEDSLPRPVMGQFHFTDILSCFTPTLKRIYLASLPNGTQLFCDAKNLCHVALAGATRRGKSTILRLLMSQLCKAGASVLLLNPHYTPYDVERDEDWTPFTPYLVRDPMECSEYTAIDFYIKWIARELLPTRLERYRHAQPVGKPYFVVIDELPAIVKRCPHVPDYLADILREGAKLNIFLIVASQDFLVKTIAPGGTGGAVRECYLTAYYVGGDATTANVLLDMPAKSIPEVTLGKGTVMFRGLETKQAVQAHIPYVDNEALYRLLGPSTYVPVAAFEEEEMQLLEHVPLPRAEPATLSPVLPEQESHSVAKEGQTPVATGKFTRNVIPPHLQEAHKVYVSGMSASELGLAIGKSKAQAARYIAQMRERRLIGS